MSQRAEAVGAWVRELRASDPSLAAASRLSPEGLRAVWSVALDELGPDAIGDALSLPGEPYATATVVVARTVLTAPLEWCAVLLARGTEVTLKVPREAPEMGHFLARTAAGHGLPLRVVTAHEAVGGELVVVMGRDETVEAVRGRVPAGTRVLGFGHRYSAAWAPGEADLREAAVQLALHDTRGCRSPVALVSDHPHAVDILADAMAEAEARWPRGTCSGHELAKIRARLALGQVLGQVRTGEGWGVMALPSARFVPEALPRVAVLHPGGPDTLAACIEPTARFLSVLGVPDPAAPPAVLQPYRHHLVALERMQRPPLRRHHDGVDWLAETLRPA